VGEVIPQTEICSNNIDDDCDGIINNGCEWLTVVRSQEDDRLHGVASNADGHTFLFGHARMDGTLHTQSQPNGTALTQNANQTSHLFLVQLDEAGSLHASHVFAPSYKSVAMASNTKQYAVIAGCGEQNLTIPGQQTYTSNLASNTTVGNIGFLSVLNLSSKSQHPFLTQHVIQFHRHGCIGGVTITDNNEVYVTGWTSGALSFGSWTSTHTDTNSAVFVAKLSKHATNPTWSWTWARVYGTSGLDFGKSIAVTQKGTVYVAGAIQRNNNSQLSFQCLWDQRQPSNCGSSNPPTIHTVNQPNHPIFLMKLNGQSAILEDVIIAGETNKINRMANLPTQQTRNEENTLSNRMLGIVGGIATIGEDVVLSATLKTTGEFGTIKTTTNANGLTTTVLARANASTSPSSMTWAWAKFYTFPGTNSAPERGPYAHQVAVQNNRIFMVGEFIGTSYSFGNNVEIKLPSEASDPIPLLGQWDANGNIMSVQTILGTAQESGATVLRGTHAFPLHLFDGTALTGGHTFAQTLSIQDSSTSFSFSSQPPGTASAYAVRIRLPTTP
jgi:23S rRNA pseudoU1915 N3-methylase RlmH